MAFDLSQLSREQQELILNGPALPAPPGIEPNFENPPNQNIIPEVVIPICLIFVCTAVLLRAYSRTFLRKAVRVDDVLALLAFCCFIGYIYCVYDVTHSVGFFVHQYHVIVRDIMPVQRILQIASNFYMISLLLGKSAILLQWIQIFAPKGARGAFYWACLITLWVNVLFYLTSGIAGNLICVPFERIWDKRVAGYCYNGRPLNFTIGSFNLFSDVVLLILPQKVIWGLHIPLNRKIGIALIFAIGLIACGAAALRVGVTFAYMNDRDWLFRVAGLSMGCIAEMTCMLLVYCIPGIPATFRDSAFLSAILRSFQSSLRSLTRRGPSTTSGSSGTEFEDHSGHRGQKGYREMGLNDLSVGRANRPLHDDSDSIRKLQPQRTQEV